MGLRGSISRQGPGSRRLRCLFPPARVGLRTYDHDLELNDLVIELEREFGAAVVVTEQEMRQRDTAISAIEAPTPTFAVPLSGALGQLQLTPRGHPRLHFPDAAVQLNTGEGIVAIELERTAKARSRIRRILSGYVAARRVYRVRYVACSDRVFTLFRSEVSRLGAEPLVEITRHSASHMWRKKNK